MQADIGSIKVISTNALIFCDVLKNINYILVENRSKEI